MKTILNFSLKRWHEQDDFFEIYVYNSEENSTIYRQEVSIHYWNTKSSSIQYAKNIRADRNDTLVPTHDVNICIILTEHFITE